MSQSKLQVYTEEATPILTAFFNTLLGQEISLKLGEASESDKNQITSDAHTSFTINGNPEQSQPFVVQLNPAWIPVISNAMVGREMSSDEEGVFDLTGQIISQSYETLKENYERSSNFPPLDATPFAPGTWNQENDLPENYWRIPFELVIGEQTLHGNLFVTNDWVDNLDTLKPASNEATNEGTPVQDNSNQGQVGMSTPQFPDFGRESIQQQGPGNFDLLAEVELNVTVELGRRKIPLSEVLKLTTGSVIELEKLVGEPLEIFANGRLIAEGEAVVIEEQFGIRITNLATSKLHTKAFA